MVVIVFAVSAEVVNPHSGRDHFADRRVVLHLP